MMTEHNARPAFNQLNWRVEGEHVCFLDPNGKVRAKRPASVQEIEIWGLYKEQIDVGQEEIQRIIKHEQNEVELRADIKSLTASCEAYRAELGKLARYLAENWPDLFTNSTVDGVGLAIELLGNYKIFKDAGATVPDPAVDNDPLQAPGTDAYALPGSSGVNPTAKPRKRKASDIKKRGE